MEHIRKQLHYRETWKRRIVFAQFFLILFFIFSYVFLLFHGISGTAQIQSLTVRTDQERLRYREQESVYLGMLDDITLTYAYAHGFVEADTVSFVTTDGSAIARLQY